MIMDTNLKLVLPILDISWVGSVSQISFSSPSFYFIKCLKKKKKKKDKVTCCFAKK